MCAEMNEHDLYWVNFSLRVTRFSVLQGPNLGSEPMGRYRNLGSADSALDRSIAHFTLLDDVS